MSNSERSEQEQVRIEKLGELRAQGFGYPNDVRLTGNTECVALVEVEEPKSAKRYTIAGRLVQMRLMGKAAFAHVQDRKGKLQVYIRKDEIGDDAFAEFKRYDIGDIIEVSGYAFLTKTEEKTLHVESIRMLTKSLIPLPEKWHGLSDVEARYRYRYVDLIANPDVRQIFRTRARVIREMRHFFDERDFLEVETPTLDYVAGGAAAKPFKTFFNALGSEMTLRIALELPLKKLVVGGLERVYEIGKNFRNEGLSTKHNPEFTMCEFYQAYASFDDLMDLTEALFGHIAKDVVGGLKFKYGDHDIDFTPPWPRLSMLDSIHDVGGVSRDIDLNTLEGVQAAAEGNSIHLEEPSDWGRCLEALWDELVEDKLINPTFITHHPYSISPLARRNADNPEITDRFELIIAGMEIANGYSELNDPEDQRERFEAQAARKEQGDEEMPEVEEDFLRALEYGMPPTAGEGIGIDRLVMLLTNTQSIREVLLFPQLKPLGHSGEEVEEPEAVSSETEAEAV